MDYKSYIERGWRVLPVWWTESGVCQCRQRVHCSSPGKHPIKELVANGSSDATSSYLTAKEWFERYPKANIGIATGAEVWVLDTDVDHGGEISIIDIEETYGRLGESGSVRTGGGGRHFYYKGDKRVRNSASKIAPGVDVRGAGGYVLAPPSNHASGRQYEWLDEPDGLEPAPDWLLEMVTETRGGSKEPIKVREHIYDGERNQYLFAYASKLRSSGFDQDDIFAHLEWLNTKCVSRTGDAKPLSEYELKRIAQSASRYGVDLGDGTDIEFALVGAVWAAPKYRYLLGKVDPRAFANDDCREWWTRMIEIIPTPPDHTLMGIGQEQYNEIISEVPKIDSAPQYAEMVRAPHARKKMQTRTERLLNAIRDEKPEDELVKIAEGIVEKSRAKVLTGGRADDDDFEPGSLIGVPTGTKIDDVMVCKGLPMAQTTVIAGLPGRGKTPLAVQIAISALGQGKTVVYWTFSDFNKAQLIQQRFMPQLCGLKERPVDAFDLKHWEESKRWLTERGLYRYDDPVSIEAVRQELSELSNTKALDLIVIDYAQAIMSDRARGAYETVQEVAAQSAVIAKETGAATLLLSQVTKEQGGGHKARYGAELEQNAAFVLQMGDRMEGENIYDQVFRFKVTKNRFGPSGQEWESRFRTDLLRFDF